MAEEKLLLQNRFNALQRHFTLISEELKTYEKNTKTDALMRAKASALTAQLQRVNEERNNLKHQLEIAQLQLKEATERERKASLELETLRKTLSQNENSIFKLKEEIIPLVEQTKTDVEGNTNVISENKHEFIDADSEKIKIQSDNMQLSDFDNVHTTETTEEEIDEEPLSFLESTNPVQEVEEVYLPEQETDLTSIFEDDEIDSKQETELEDDGIIVEEVKPTDINQIVHYGQTDTEEIKKSADLPSDEDAYTDHSIRRSIISRPQHIRNPITTFGKNEEYSDFLKKTKSLFYRIKWSLFKD